MPGMVQAAVATISTPTLQQNVYAAGLEWSFMLPMSGRLLLQGMSKVLHRAQTG